MNEIFRQHVEALDPRFQELLAATPYKRGMLPRGMPLAGIYLLSEGSVYLYVGRSRNMRRRLGYHCSSSHTVASFAFLLARRETGYTKPSYTKEGSRVELHQREEFRAAFERARERIREMDIRFVEETDPTRQALLEIYAAISLNTPYNKFETT